jgi:phytoene dehydrogenase-like protein
MADSPGKIATIGAGIAGLCAAVYARRRGYEVEVLEQHNTAGGLATSWRRGDYTFETCLHWLLGSRPEAPLSPRRANSNVLRFSTMRPHPARCNSLTGIYAGCRRVWSLGFRFETLRSPHSACRSRTPERGNRGLHVSALPGDTTELRK